MSTSPSNPEKLELQGLFFSPIYHHISLPVPFLGICIHCLEAVRITHKFDFTFGDL